MANRTQAFDTLQNRLISPAAAPPTPTTPSLAAVYAFGLSDDPFADNLFAMPAGNLRFTGAVSWGSRWDSTVEYFEDRTKYNPISPPPYDFVSLATTVGALGSRTFQAYVLNDPAWTGVIPGLDQTWVAEVIGMSRDTSEASLHAATSLASRSFSSFGTSPFTANPNSSGVGHAMQESLSLYDSLNGAPQVTSISTGFGMQQLLVRAIENGANAQWCTHWANNASVPAAGDGPAWLIDGIGAFNSYSPRAGIQAYQRTNDQLGAYGWRLYLSDGLVQPMKLALDVNLDGGTLNGAAIATIDAGTREVLKHSNPRRSISPLYPPPT